MAFLHLLDQKEQDEMKMVSELFKKTKYNHGVRLADFKDNLELLRSYCHKGDDEDWKRCLVCGVCWMPDLIAVNNQRLAAFTGRSKSTVNDLLAKMDLHAVLLNKRNRASLVEAVPYLARHRSELRQWTIRANPEKYAELLPKRNREEEEDFDFSWLEMDFLTEDQEQPLKH